MRMTLWAVFSDPVDHPWPDLWGMLVQVRMTWWWAFWWCLA